MSNLSHTLLLLYINDLPDDVICNIAIYADDTTLVIRHLICGNKLNWLLNLNLNRFPVCWNLFCASFSCLSMPCSDCSTLHGVNPN